MFLRRAFLFTQLSAAGDQRRRSGHGGREQGGRRRHGQGARTIPLALSVDSAFGAAFLSAGGAGLPPDPRRRARGARRHPRHAGGRARHVPPRRAAPADVRRGRRRGQLRAPRRRRGRRRNGQVADGCARPRAVQHLATALGAAITNPLAVPVFGAGAFGADDGDPSGVGEPGRRANRRVRAARRRAPRRRRQSADRTRLRRVVHDDGYASPSRREPSRATRRPAAWDGTTRSERARARRPGGSGQKWGIHGCAGDGDPVRCAHDVGFPPPRRTHCAGASRSSTTGPASRPRPSATGAQGLEPPERHAHEEKDCWSPAHPRRRTGRELRSADAGNRKRCKRQSTSEPSSALVSFSGPMADEQSDTAGRAFRRSGRRVAQPARHRDGPARAARLGEARIAELPDGTAELEAAPGGTRRKAAASPDDQHDSYWTDTFVPRPPVRTTWSGRIEEGIRDDDHPTL